MHFRIACQSINAENQNYFLLKQPERTDNERETYLSILRSGNVYQSLGRRVYNFQKFQNCGSIIRNSGFACKITSCKSQHEAKHHINMISRNVSILPNKRTLLNLITEVQTYLCYPPQACPCHGGRGWSAQPLPQPGRHWCCWPAAGPPEKSLCPPLGGWLEWAERRDSRMVT